MDTGIKKLFDSIEFALSLKSYRICILRPVDTNENNYLSKYQLNIHQEVHSWYGGVIVIIFYIHYFEAEVGMGICSNIQLVSSPSVSHDVHMRSTTANRPAKSNEFTMSFTTSYCKSHGLTATQANLIGSLLSSENRANVVLNEQECIQERTVQCRNDKDYVSKTVTDFCKMGVPCD